MFKNLKNMFNNEHRCPSKRGIKVLPDGLVEGGTEQLAGVFTETDACDSFTVGTFKPPQTLAALDLPHLHTHFSLFLQHDTVSGSNSFNYYETEY